MNSSALSGTAVSVEWSIRSMVIADLDEIARLESQIYPYPWTRNHFADSLAAGYEAQVVLCADQLLGYWLMMHAPDVSHLLNLSVRHEFQRHGYGTRMLNILMQRARENRFAAILLEVRPTNVAAIRLYERAGFGRIGIRRAYYPGPHGQREDAVVMRYELSPTSL